MGEPDPVAKFRDPRLPERFWSKVTLDQSGCWLWTASHGYMGHGSFWNGTRMVPAHRFAYEVLREPIPEILVCDHLCRTPPCVNPYHIEPVTDAENVRRGTNREALRAASARKTHCPQGHPYSGPNLIIRMQRGSTTRICRTCKADNARRHKDRRNAAAKAARGLQPLREALELIERSILLYGEACADGHSDCVEIARAALSGEEEKVR